MQKIRYLGQKSRPELNLNFGFFGSLPKQNICSPYETDFFGKFTLYIDHLIHIDTYQCKNTISLALGIKKSNIFNESLEKGQKSHFQ